LDEKYPLHNFRYVPKNIAVFGQTAPAITIGISRPPPPPPEDFPSPDAYNVDPKTLYIDIPHLIQNRQETDYSTLTSGVDFLDLVPFTRPQTNIGGRDNFRFFAINDAPAPSFFPETTWALKPITIGGRITTTVNATDSPGPGQYEALGSRPDTAGFTIPRNPKRELWDPPAETPNPGLYNVLPQLSKPKRWAGKLRVPVPAGRVRRSLDDAIHPLPK
jgi:hypothetical protein